MKKKSLIIIGVLVVAAIGLACAAGPLGLYASGKWRYKMTVAVETPEGIKTGSAVREVSNARFGTDLGWPHVTHSPDIIGEAVVIDLGKRGILFALISGDSPQDIASAFGTFQPVTVESIRYYDEHLKPGMKAELTKDLPQFVLFKDIKDPLSVQAVDEGNLAASFGRGVELRRIEIEITDEPVTTGIEKFLPWLNDLGGKYLHGKLTSRNAPFGLHAGNFHRGNK